MTTANQQILTELSAMQPHVRVCKECEKSFQVRVKDIEFYKKFIVPAPTLCPSCRNLRRFALRNERSLYIRNCDKSGRKIVSIYSQDKPYKVYGHEEFWNDYYDATIYGQEYDSNKSFFEQFQELQLKVPRITSLVKNSENSEYTNQSANNKNSYMGVEVFDSENIIHSWWILKCKDCLDCSFLPNNCENCYELIDSTNCNSCFFSNYLKNCANTLFCYDCQGSHNCILSSNLRGKEYFVRNKQVTKEEFEIEKKNIFANLNKAKDEYIEMIKDAVHIFARLEGSENCIGNNLINCKNVFIGYDSFDSENCDYMDRAFGAKDCMDAICFGMDGSEMQYETHGTIGSFLYFSTKCYQTSFSEYCDIVFDSKYCFGCVGLKRKQYCILNKQYTKEEYESLVNQIKLDMLSRGEYGEFFPVSMSPFGYNETVAMEYKPLTKEEAMMKGYKWKDDVSSNVFSAEFYSPKEISYYYDESHAKELLSATLKCFVSGLPFKIAPSELSFYLKNSLSIPTKHPNIRHKDRMALRPPREIHKRKCSNPTCNEIIYSPYAEGKEPGKVYCERCYNKEIY